MSRYGGDHGESGGRRRGYDERGRSYNDDGDRRDYYGVMSGGGRGRWEKDRYRRDGYRYPSRYGRGKERHGRYGGYEDDRGYGMRGNGAREGGWQSRRRDGDHYDRGRDRVRYSDARSPRSRSSSRDSVDSEVCHPPLP